MALVNRKVGLMNKKLSRAIRDSMYDTKYFENKDALLKSISFIRDLSEYSFYYSH